VEVLVISSQSALVRPVCITLQQQGFRTQISTLEAAQRKLAICDAAVLLCTHQDDHLHTIEHWRSQDIEVPLIALQFIGARAAPSDLLDRGADAVLTHPVPSDLLNAQLRALLRRRLRFSQNLLVSGNLSLDTASQTARLSGVSLNLTAVEFKLLHLLMRSSPSVVHRNVLEQCLLHDQLIRKTNAIVVHIYHLRAKIGNHCIESVRSVGYRLTSPT
jgi:DNA-binding response OmpR family regulator